MSNNQLYLIVGGLIAVFIILSFVNRGKNKARKSRKFMSDYERKSKNN